MGWAEEKARLRRGVHDQFGVTGRYSLSGGPVTLFKVGFHSKIGWASDTSASGLETLEGIDRIRFNVEHFAAPYLIGTDLYGGVTPVRNGIVHFPQYQDIAFSLEVLDPPDGPINVIWTVSRVTF